MTDTSGKPPNHWLLGVSAICMIVGLLLGGVLILQNDGGGVFANLGLALGLMAIAAGNLLSWLVNLLCWRLTRRRWLARVLAVQTMPAVALLAGLAVFGTQQVLEARASGQRAAVIDAIKADDRVALQESMTRCGKRCREILSDQRIVMLASLHGAHKVAGMLLVQGVELTAHGGDAPAFYNTRTDLHSCEGTYLSSLGALEVAVAREDQEMLALLWPASDQRTRMDALWTAARLDRLQMVKFMVDAAMAVAPALPLVRKNFQGDRESLLRAAASGAAVEVASWLLEQRPPNLLPPDMLPAEIQRAMTDLLGFMVESDARRTLAFARLLMRHGADIRTAQLDGEPALERALHYRSRTLAGHLLELGVDPESLSKADGDALEGLLQQPARSRTYYQNREGCVAP